MWGWGALLVLGSSWLTFLLVGGILMRFFGVLFSFSNNCFKIFVLVGASEKCRVLVFGFGGWRVFL